MQVVPKELLNKEFLSQFKTKEDVSNFPNKCLKARWTAIWVMRRTHPRVKPTINIT
jgi:hypothetical protein